MIDRALYKATAKRCGECAWLNMYLDGDSGYGGGIMAEFVEVIRQWKRMCRAHSKCGECPACNVMCGILTVNPEVGEEIENIVTDWAKAHPEMVYPTWYDWQKENFPHSTRYICPRAFGVG